MFAGWKTAENIPDVGEIVFDPTTGKPYYGDGSTVGGKSVAPEADSVLDALEDMTEDEQEDARAAIGAGLGSATALAHQRTLMTTDATRMVAANVSNTGAYLLGKKDASTNNTGNVTIGKMVDGSAVTLATLSAGGLFALPQDNLNDIVATPATVGDGVRVVGNFVSGAASTSRSGTDVTASSYGRDPVASGTAWGPSTTAALDDFFVLGNKYRIRRSGMMTAVKFPCYLKPENLTKFTVTVWRKDGATYDLIAETEDLLPAMVPTTATTHVLATPIAVKIGDFLGYRYYHAGGTAANTNYCNTGLTGVTTYKHTPASETDFNPTSGGTAYANTAMRLSGVVTPCVVTSIGDSLVAGHYTGSTGNLTFCEDSTTSDLAIPFQATLGPLIGHEIENMGIGSQNTTHIAARFAADVVDAGARVCIINGGVNDLAAISDPSDVAEVATKKATFIANWTTILDAAAAASPALKMVVLQMWPWTDGTDDELPIRDDWNTALADLCSTYSNVLCINLDSTLGKNRATGPDGNLWDIKTSPDYDSDGIHLTALGYAAAGTAIANAIKTWFSANKWVI